ncbi:hypothetical protein Gpo141_00011295 [Globisporangium polare]
MQLLRFVALATLAFTGAVTAKTTTTGNDTISLGDGTSVKAVNSTVFLGTEYNANRCVLQFESLQCTNKDCAELNGYPLECVNVGKENGKDKKLCECRANETDVCQNSTMPGVSGSVPQFGDCSDSKQCVDSYGHVSSKLELRICAEKLHCVKEVNTTATKPAEICHTCRSCIAQNDDANAKLSGTKRFDCTKICPQEILDSLSKRNAAGVGIADELSSASASESGSEEGSTSGSLSASSTSGSSATKKSAAVATPFSLSAAVAGLVAVTVSMALVN